MTWTSACPGYQVPDGRSGFEAYSKVAFTSWAVKGWPRWNLMSLRKLYSSQPSSTTFWPVAIS